MDSCNAPHHDDETAPSKSDDEHALPEPRLTKILRLEASLGDALDVGERGAGTTANRSPDRWNIFRAPAQRHAPPGGERRLADHSAGRHQRSQISA